MKKIYVTLLLLCAASIFSSQLYNDAFAKAGTPVAPANKDSSNIISNIVALPSFR